MPEIAVSDLYYLTCPIGLIYLKTMKINIVLATAMEVGLATFY